MKNSQIKSRTRAQALATRLLEGANLLADYANKLTDEQWVTPVSGDGRTVGVVVHHVANMYPLEVELAQTLAACNPITGATMAIVNHMNADHAKEFADVGKVETIELLNKNSSDAAKAVRIFTDEELNNAATVSLNANAPLTSQFFIEDHAMRHSFHHLAKIRETLEK